MMGKFTAIGMRTPVEDDRALVVNTCSDNDKCLIGNNAQWSWCNPTNRLFEAVHPEDDAVRAVSIEALWQGTKIFKAGGRPDPFTLDGDWRRGKGKKPIGSWAGEGRALHQTPGDARRAIYIPAFIRQIYRILMSNNGAEALLRYAGRQSRNVFLRDWDTGRGLEQRGPMSHAWVLANILNTGDVPEAQLKGELKQQAEAIHLMAQRG